jgi:linoleoyl-CoA desaturase
MEAQLHGLCGTSILVLAMTEGQLQPLLKFDGNMEFQTALRRNVNLYFARAGRPSRGNWQVYLKAIIILCCFFASYMLLLFVAKNARQGVAASICLAFSMAGIGFDIMHDGGHRAFSEHRWVNRVAAATLDLIGVSSHMWHWKHAMYHHNYVNIGDYDPDVDLGILARFAPSGKRRCFHRWQHLYIWGLYAFLVAKLHLFSDFHSLIFGKIHSQPVPRPKGWDLIIFVAGKTALLVLAFALPLFYHPALSVVFYYGLTVLMMGMPLSVVFQLPHCTGRAGHPMPDEATHKMKNPWAVHQAEVTLDFDRRSRVKTWFFGGLNYHLEHHLFPSICHVNYPGISKIVEETCREFGVKYAEHRAFWAGLVERYRWLKEMGRVQIKRDPE